MLQLFKTSHPTFTLIFGVFVIISFRLVMLHHGVQIHIWEEPLAPISRLLVRLVGLDLLQSSLFNLTLSGFFVALQAWIVGQITNRYKLLEKTSYLPIWIFILIAHFSPSFLIFSPVIIASTFALLFLNIVSLDSFTKKNVSKVFNLGLLISLAFLTWYPALFLLPFLLFVFFIKPSFTVRGLVALLIAITIPFIYIFFYYFMIDGLELELPKLFATFHFNTFSFSTNSISNKMSVLLLSCYGVIGIIASINYSQRTSNNTRNLLNMLYAFLFAALLGFLLQDNNHFAILFVLTPPIAILLSVFIHKIKNKRLAEIAHLVLFLSVVIHFTFIIYQL